MLCILEVSNQDMSIIFFFEQMTFMGYEKKKKIFKLTEPNSVWYNILFGGGGRGEGHCAPNLGKSWARLGRDLGKISTKKLFKYCLNIVGTG